MIFREGNIKDIAEGGVKMWDIFDSQRSEKILKYVEGSRKATTMLFFFLVGQQP